MMKYITSTTGEKIIFNLTSTRTVIIDTVVPVEVSEVEFNLLSTRLGSQIKSHDMSTTSETTSTPIAPPLVPPLEDEIIEGAVNEAVAEENVEVSKKKK